MARTSWLFRCFHALLRPPKRAAGGPAGQDRPRASARRDNGRTAGSKSSPRTLDALWRILRRSRRAVAASRNTRPVAHARCEHLGEPFAEIGCSRIVLAGEPQTQFDELSRRNLNPVAAGHLCSPLLWIDGCSPGHDMVVDFVFGIWRSRRASEDARYVRLVLAEKQVRRSTIRTRTGRKAPAAVRVVICNRYDAVVL